MDKTQELLDLIYGRRSTIITGDRCFRFDAPQMDILIDALKKAGGDIELSKERLEEARRASEEEIRRLEADM